MSGRLNQPIRAVVGARRRGFFVTFKRGSETVDEAGPFDEHHEAVDAARRTLGPRDTVFPLPSRPVTSAPPRSDTDTSKRAPMPAIAWRGGWV